MRGSGGVGACKRGGSLPHLDSGLMKITPRECIEETHQSLDRFIVPQAKTVLLFAILITRWQGHRHFPQILRM